MKKRLLHFLGPLLGIIILSIALTALHHILKAYRYHDVVATLRQLPPQRIFMAAALTAVSYLLLTLYDTLGVRYIHHPLEYRRIALASFIGYAFNNNLGFAGVAGNSLRYRIYTTWGLSAIEVAKVIGFCILTFWLGFLTVGGVAFLVDPLPIPSSIHLPISSIRPLGFLFLIPIAGYLTWNMRRKEPIRIKNWAFELPSPGISFAQIAIASLDWSVAASVLYMLLPPGHGLSYWHFLSIFLFAQTVSLISHVPGGLGVFETVMLYCLVPPFSAPTIAGTLLAYRAVYYLMPLGVAVVLLGAHELILRVEKVRQTASILSQWVPVLVPNVFAFTTFIAGAILLFSGATPSEHTRIHWLNDFLPLPIMEASHFLGSVAGVGLMLLARGLQRRLDAAYHLSIVLLVAGIAFSIFKGFDYEEAITLSVMLVALLPCRPHFYRKASLISQPLTPGWSAAILLALVASVWLGIFSYKHVDYNNDLWWQFSLKGDAPRFLRATVGAVSVALFFAIRMLLKPATPEPQTLSGEDWEAVKRIVKASPKTYAYAALLGDKSILLSKSRKAFIMYGIEGRSWVALGDPVGPESEMQELVWEFREMSDAHDGWTVFYHILADSLPLYLDLGLVLLKLGEEALVPIDHFTLEGKSRKGLRHSHNRVAGEGCLFEIIPPEQVPPLIPELKAISDAWLTAKSTREKGFSLGHFTEEYIRELPIALVRQQGRIVAFANLWPGAGQEELSIDMMRYVPEMHGGVMDYLFIELMFWGKAQGYKWFNLGMAPLSGLENRALAPLWTRIGALVYRHGEHFYNFQGLRQYKEKFDPVWVPKYLASPGGIALPRILTNIAALISGSVRGIIAR